MPAFLRRRAALLVVVAFAAQAAGARMQSCDMTDGMSSHASQVDHSCAAGNAHTEHHDGASRACAVALGCSLAPAMVVAQQRPVLAPETRAVTPGDIFAAASRTLTPDLPPPRALRLA
jgi:hypothetical protein